MRDTKYALESPAVWRPDSSTPNNIFLPYESGRGRFKSVSHDLAYSDLYGALYHENS